MGVTKQAVQKRFTPKEFEWSGTLSRFTERARHALSAANEVAGQHRHDYIGTEHLAFGLLHFREALSVKAIEAAGITVQSAREALEAAFGPASVDEVPSGQLAYTRHATKAMDLTLREALRLDHNYIGTEHILLGLLAEQNGRGGEVLRDLGLTTGGVEQWLVAELANLAR